MEANKAFFRALQSGAGASGSSGGREKESGGAAAVGTANAPSALVVTAARRLARQAALGSGQTQVRCAALR